MLKVENLHVSVENREILRGLDLTVNPAEFHVIMGPNGSGKSTLALTIAGHPKYTVTGGRITFDGEEITELGPTRGRREAYCSPSSTPTRSRALK